MYSLMVCQLLKLPSETPHTTEELLCGGVTDHLRYMKIMIYDIILHTSAPTFTVFICIYIYIYVFVYVYIYICIYIYTHNIYIYICTYVLYIRVYKYIFADEAPTQKKHMFASKCRLCNPTLNKTHSTCLIFIASMTPGSKSSRCWTSPTPAPCKKVPTRIFF